MKKSNTRAASGSGTIRQRKDGTWEARYTVGRDPGTNKQIQRSIYGKTQKEVRQRLQQISVSLDEGSYIAPSKMTVGQWLEEWQSNYLGAVKESTTFQYSANIRTNIKPHIGAVLLSELSPHMIQHLYNNLMKPHTITVKDSSTLKPIKKELAALSAKSVRNVHGTLHKALKQALLLGYIRSNPADAVVLPRVDRKEVSFVHDDYIPRLLEAIKGDRFEHIFEVDLFTGLRQGEILGLTWDCVDFDNGILTINKQLQRRHTKGGGFELNSPKNKRSRQVTASPYVMDILRQERQLQLENKLKSCGAWRNDWNLVFTDELGNHHSDKTVFSHFKRIVSSIGLPDTRFHDLRHTFAMLSLQNGDDIKTVQQNVGHATAAFTLDVYGHVSERMKNESAARMQRYIEGLKNVK